MSSESGDLSSMAATGTTIPPDAGTQNTIPSVPRPDQITSSSTAPDLASAADNSADLPRRHKDAGATGEVVTGTGDQLPASVESKNLDAGAAGNAAAKGHGRDEKHRSGGVSEVERLAGEGAGVDVVPGEEEDEVDESRERKGL